MIDLTQHLASVPPAVFLPAAKSMLTVPIQVMGDIVTARQHGRRLSLEIGSGAMWLQEAAGERRKLVAGRMTKGGGGVVPGTDR